MAKILLIEDHKDSRDLIRLVLELDGHTLVEATSGEDGLKVAAGFRPDLVILDISLAGDIDGIETLNRLRTDARFDATPVVALTAHAMKTDEQTIIAAGFDRYLTKPIIDFEAFKGQINDQIQNGRNTDIKRIATERLRENPAEKQNNA